MNGVPRRCSAAGRQLLVEGRHDSHVELIRHGFVKVTTSADAHQQMLAVRFPGDIVGELAAVGGGNRSATVTACGEVTSTAVRQADFLSFLHRHPDAALQVTTTVGERLGWANARRTDFVSYPVHIRLARVLAEIAVRCGVPVDDGLQICVELSQPELATLVGAAEDTVQKALRTLRSANLLRTGYRRIVVLNVEGLLGLADRE